MDYNELNTFTGAFMDNLIELEQLANELSEKGKLQEAVKVRLELLTKAPDWEHGEGHLLLGHDLAKLGDDAGSIAAYEEALKLCYNQSNSIFTVPLAHALAKAGQLDRVIEILVLTFRDTPIYEPEINELLDSLRILATKIKMSTRELGSILIQKIPEGAIFWSKL